MPHVGVFHVPNYIFLKNGEKGSHGDKGSQGKDGPQGQKGKQGPRGMPGTCDTKVFAARYLGFLWQRVKKDLVVTMELLLKRLQDLHSLL